MPSSLPEQIIPLLNFPYVSRALILNSPGSTAPGSATTTKSFTLKLRAPHITNLVFPSPVSKPTYLIGFLCSDNSSILTTLPTLTGPVKSVPCTTTLSTSNPTFTKASAIASLDIFAGSTTCLLSQLNGTFIAYPLQNVE